MIRPLALALVFLTRIPLSLGFDPAPRDWGRAACFFPVVGLLLGALLLSAAALPPTAGSPLAAALLLLLWVALTGGLHLDGLADVCDAWSGGGGDRERTLALLKDPRAGAMAVIGVALTLLLKFAALQSLLQPQRWQALLLAPVVGRATMLGLLLTTPYVRPGGLGAVFTAQLPRAAGAGVLAATGVFCLGLLGWGGLALIGIAGVNLLFLRYSFVKRLGGITGDTLGAACELAETLVLVILAFNRLTAT